MTNDLYDFFIFPNSNVNETTKKENNSISSYKVENKNNYNIINESDLIKNIVMIISQNIFSKKI